MSEMVAEFDNAGLSCLITRNLLVEGVENVTA